VLIITVLLVIVISLGCIWVTPSVRDFMTSNVLWNGLRDFCDETNADIIHVLDTLPTVTQGVTLVAIPYVKYDDEELSQVEDFVTNGGTLLLMDDYGYGNDVLEHLGVDARFTNVPLLDSLFCYKNPWMPRITDFSGVKGEEVGLVVLNHPTSLTGVADSEVVAWSSSYSFLDYNEDGVQGVGEEKGPFPVAAKFRLGKGTVALISDPSMVINTMMRRDDNYSLVEYLIGSDGTGRGEVLIDRAHLEERVVVLIPEPSTLEEGDYAALEGYPDAPGDIERGRITIDRSHLGRSPLDEFKFVLGVSREVLSAPYPLLGLVAIIFAVVSRYTLKKEELLG